MVQTKPIERCKLQTEVQTCLTEIRDISRKVELRNIKETRVKFGFQTHSLLVIARYRPKDALLWLVMVGVLPGYGMEGSANVIFWCQLTLVADVLGGPGPTCTTGPAWMTGRTYIFLTVTFSYVFVCVCVCVWLSVVHFTVCWSILSLVFLCCLWDIYIKNTKGKKK